MFKFTCGVISPLEVGEVTTMDAEEISNIPIMNSVSPSEVAPRLKGHALFDHFVSRPIASGCSKRDTFEFMNAIHALGYHEAVRMIQWAELNVDPSVVEYAALLYASRVPALYARGTEASPAPINSE